MSIPGWLSFKVLSYINFIINLVYITKLFQKSYQKKYFKNFFSQNFLAIKSLCWTISSSFIRAIFFLRIPFSWTWPCPFAKKKKKLFSQPLLHLSIRSLVVAFSTVNSILPILCNTDERLNKANYSFWTFLVHYKQCYHNP